MHDFSRCKVYLYADWFLLKKKKGFFDWILLGREGAIIQFFYLQVKNKLIQTEKEKGKESNCVHFFFFWMRAIILCMQVGVASPDRFTKEYLTFFNYSSWAIPIIWSTNDNEPFVLPQKKKYIAHLFNLYKVWISCRWATTLRAFFGRKWIDKTNLENSPSTKWMETMYLYHQIYNT